MSARTVVSRVAAQRDQPLEEHPVMTALPELDQALVAELTPTCEVASPDCQAAATWIVKAQ